MRILDGAVVRDRYDVIVVGAGNGGLTTAALLAKRGLKVLVVEQHYIPGGCVTAIRRHDATLDVGAAILYGWGEKGYNPHRFVMNELEEEIDMIRHESIWRMHLLGSQVTVWHDKERFLHELTALFPHQDREIRALYAEFQEFYEAMVMANDVMVPPTEISPPDGLRSFLKNPIGMMKLLRFLLKSEEEVINKHVSDPEVLCFFDFVTGLFTQCNATESPAILGATMFIDNHVGGACYPSGSPQMLPNKLERAIEKNGGQILYRELVDEILIYRGKAYGIRLKNGTEIMADRIVSNADVYHLYGSLVKPRHIRPKRMAWAQRFDPSVCALLLYLVVDREAVPEDAQPIELLCGNIHSFSEAICVFIPSKDDPSLCPPDKHSLTVIAPTSLKWPRPGDRFYQSDAYYALKQQQADLALDQLEKWIFPNIRAHIVSMDIGTPSTLERYARKAHGHVGGPKLTMKQHFFARLKARSEWENLYCAGDSTSMGEGVVATCVSGIGAANQILRDMRLPEFKPRPYARQYVRIVQGSPWTETPHRSEPIVETSAMRIARDCQHCDQPECKKACPARIETCHFARRIEAGNFAGAARALREVNPLSETCGFICPSERFCEKACSRLDFDDRPVRIRELHRWVCGHVPGDDGWDRHAPPHNGHRVAVVGAGPAGLTCAHYLARLGYRVDIFDKSDRPGGMMIGAIPAGRLPEQVLRREIEMLTVPGMQFHYGKELGTHLSVDGLRNDYDAVFLAPGLWAGRTLQVPGMQRAKVTDALRFLTQARTKGGVQVGRRVLVIGGGSVAADAARVAHAAGARETTVVCLESEQEMPCLPRERHEMLENGIRIAAGWGPKEITSKTRMVCRACTAVLDDQGRFAPAFDEATTRAFAFDEILLAIGQTTEPPLAAGLKEAFGKEGLPAVHAETREVTGHPGVFAGGDITRGAGTVVEAVGDGRRAAQAIDRSIVRR